MLHYDSLRSAIDSSAMLTLALESLADAEVGDTDPGSANESEACWQATYSLTDDVADALDAAGLDVTPEAAQSLARDFIARAMAVLDGVEPDALD